MDERVKNMWDIYMCVCVCVCVCVYLYIHTHTHIMEYYSVIKMNEILPLIATRIYLEIIIILSEVSQGKANNIWYYSHVESKKKLQLNLFTKQKHTHIENLWFPKGKGVRRDKSGVWNEQINNKVLLYSTGNYIQYLLISVNGKEFEAVCLKLTQYCKSTIK